MMFLLTWFSRILLGVRFVWKRTRMYLYMPAFKRHGSKFIFDPDGHYSFHNIEVGDDVTINNDAILLAAESRVIIGNKVMFGPRVTVIGGNRNTSVIGRYMKDVEDKRPQDDEDVIIEDDVWVGTGSVILKGVKIGRGAVVAAGSVVVKNVLPYTIVGGTPAKIISLRFGNIENVVQHEALLYPAEKRLTTEILQEISENVQKH